MAALVQYFFLAAFSWMLCEGVLLYLMLVVVFGSLIRKWWVFFVFGWGKCVVTATELSLQLGMCRCSSDPCGSWSGHSSSAVCHYQPGLSAHSCHVRENSPTPLHAHCTMSICTQMLVVSREGNHLGVCGPHAGSDTGEVLLSLHN